MVRARVEESSKDDNVPHALHSIVIAIFDRSDDRVHVQRIFAVKFKLIQTEAA